MTAPIHSIWLMPRAEDEDLLAGIVAELSQRFDTPLFAPHLTVKGDTDITVAKLEAAIREAAASVAAFSEDIAAVETSDAYFRSFYARFPVNAPLERLKRHLDGELAASFMPHVSLLYGPVPPGPKARASEEIAARLVARPVGFDRLCVVTSGQDVPIAEWTIVASAPLR